MFELGVTLPPDFEEVEEFPLLFPPLVLVDETMDEDASLTDVTAFAPIIGMRRTPPPLIRWCVRAATDLVSALLSSRAALDAVRFLWGPRFV